MISLKCDTHKGSTAVTYDSIAQQLLEMTYVELAE
jgi:hypothetical protein